MQSSCWQLETLFFGARRLFQAKWYLLVGESRGVESPVGALALFLTMLVLGCLSIPDFLVASSMSSPKVGAGVRPGNPQLSHDVTIGRLDDFGIDRMQSSRWQLEAGLGVAVC